GAAARRPDREHRPRRPRWPRRGERGSPAARLDAPGGHRPRALPGDARRRALADRAPAGTARHHDAPRSVAAGAERARARRRLRRDQLVRARLTLASLASFAGQGESWMSAFSII